MKYKEAWEYLHKRNRELKCNEFINDVKFKHNDGSEFKLSGAIVEFCGSTGNEFIKEWILIFSEHHPPLIYSIDDLEYYTEIKPNGGRICHIGLGAK